MAYSGPGDDETVSVVSFEGGGGEVVVGGDECYDDLKSEAEAAQRLAVTRLLRLHVKGSAEVLSPASGTKIAERRFNVPKLFQWSSGEPEAVIDALAEGRVRARVNATMGTGKSTSFPQKLAKALGRRVLLVGLDALQLQANAVYIARAAIGKVDRRWSDKNGARVNVMTYADFVSFHVSSKRKVLYRSFDIIVFDEAFVGEADVMVAKRCFSVYADSEVSLLLCSATMSTDLNLSEVGSAGMGNFRRLSESLDLEAAIQSGKMVGEYLTDRTLVVLPTDGQQAVLAEYYEANGVDAKVLDSAATFEDEREVIEWLKGDATTPRILVACPKYAIGFNAPLAFEILWPYRSFVEVVDNVVVERVVPMTEEMVVQATARTGRGMVSQSSGIIMSPEREETTELYESEKLRAFVQLCSVSISPMRSDYWAQCYGVFPKGLTASEACSMLKVCLPVSITPRFLGSDGFVARKFQRALNFFSQPNHFVVASESELPVGYEEWPLEPVGGYCGPLEECGGELLKVPVHATGELRVVLHAIAAIAEGKFSLSRWQPTRPMAFDDGYDSAEEDDDPRFPVKFGRLRRVKERPLPEIPRVVVPATQWSYNSSEQVNRRSGVANFPLRIKEGLNALNGIVGNYEVPVTGLYDVDVKGGQDVGVITFGTVESPGGSEVCRIPLSICQKMNVGKRLKPQEFVQMVVCAVSDKARFVASKMFDCWSGPWDSVLDSLLDVVVVERVVRDGLTTDVYEIVDLMRRRHGIETNSVLAKSHVFNRTYARVFKVRPSVDSLMRAIRNGKFDRVAQSEGFINRVKELKTLIDRVLVFAECQNIWLPSYITSAQRGLALRGDTPLGVCGAGMDKLPSSVGETLMGRRFSAGEAQFMGRLEERFNRGH